MRGKLESPPVRRLRPGSSCSTSCPVPLALRPLPRQCPHSGKGVGGHGSNAPSSGSAHKFLWSGKEKESLPAPWDGWRMAVGGKQTARASPAAPGAAVPRALSC